MAKSSASRRRNNGRRRKPLGPSAIKKAAMIAAPCVILIGAGFAAMQYIDLEKIGADYCFDRPDQAQHSFLIDNSLGADNSAAQQRDYRRVFENAYDQADANTRFMIFSTASDVQGSIAKPVAATCKPPSNVIENDALGSPSKQATYLRRQAEDARAAFDALVDAVMADAQDTSKAASDSPILEQLQAISRYRGFQSRKRSLTVLSDFIQNSETSRFCIVQGDLPSFAIFKSQPRYSVVAPDSLEDVRVNMMVVEQGRLPHDGMPYCTWPEIRTYWTDYFNHNGAAKVILTRLRYGTP